MFQNNWKKKEKLYYQLQTSDFFWKVKKPYLEATVEFEQAKRKVDDRKSRIQ